MGDLSSGRRLSERVAGKWQLPLLALSLVALPAALYCLRPNPKSMPLDKVTKAVEAFVKAGAYSEAAEMGQVAVGREDCVGPAAGPIHLQMARALFGLSLQSNRQTANAGRTISEHYRQAAAQNADLEPEDHVKMGRALEWGRQYALALESLDQALAGGYEDRPGLLRHVYLLRRDKLRASPQELAGLVDDFLASAPADRVDLIGWGIEERLGLLAATSETDKAEGLLDTYAARFAGSDFANLFEYFRAWVLFHSGKNTEAELALRALRNRVDSTDPVSAQSGWLLGRALLKGGDRVKLDQAVSFFRNVLSNHPDGQYALASRVGLAEALAALGDHSEAAELYRFAIEDLEAGPTSLVQEDEIRVSLMVLAEQLRRSSDLSAGLAYAETMRSLIDWNDPEQASAHLQQLGAIQTDLADRLAGSTDAESVSHARGLYRRAADTYSAWAQLDVHDAERSAEAEWRSAELFARAGDRGEAIDRYRIFAESRPSHSLVPRALFRIGQLQQAAGRLTEAIAVYQDCYQRFPKLLDGVRSLVPLAQCYVFRGPDDLELAEKTLRIILEESEVFTPDAPEFADALFLLGDVLERRGRYEDAIATLMEAIDRYPLDPRGWRARFLLADSYRQSAFALKQEAMAVDHPGDATQVREEADKRFAAARAAYRKLIDECELRRSEELSALERMYLRHAYLYEADCYFEARLYREALGRYDQAAGLMRGSPSALAAYVQIINCHVFLGQPAEAKAALARAQVRTERMSPEAFAQGISAETREDWKEYFAWLERAEIF